MSDKIRSGNCHDCGLEYGGKSWIEAVIPDQVWEEISPTQDMGGILCISCMAKRLRAFGCKPGTIPVWLCGMEPLMSMPGDPSDDIETLRTFQLGDRLPRKNGGES